MTDILQHPKSTLDRLKTNVENTHRNFKKNYDNFTANQRIVFISAMDENSLSVNNTIDRPNLEANSLEVPINRFCGEFAKNPFGISISASDDYEARNPEGQQLINKAELAEALEGYARHIIHESQKYGTVYYAFRDIISGGFSNLKIVADYVDNRSFHQELRLEKCHESVLTGFDPLAMKPDKSDAEYCFEIYPMRDKDFEEKYPEIDITNIRFAMSLGNFEWTYILGKDKIVLVADYYEKVHKKTKLYELANGMVLIEKDYKKFVKNWDESGTIEIAPAIIRERPTVITSIKRYQFIENQIISEEDTDYTDLPIKFMDGNSVMRKDDMGGAKYQFTRPFWYQATGSQLLKNLAMQCLANELQMVRPMQLIASIESIPAEYLDAYTNPQPVTTLPYYEISEENPDVRLSAPQVMPRQLILGDLMQTFVAADNMINTVLGAADNQMSEVAKRQGSGKAIEKFETFTNVQIIPYLHNCSLTFQSCLQTIVDMIPLYYTSERTLPIIGADGKRGAININQENGISFEYKPGDFKVKVQTDVNFTQQQQQTFDQLTAAMSSNPKFAQFIGDTSMDVYVRSLPHLKDADLLIGRMDVWTQAQNDAQRAMMEKELSEPKLEEKAMMMAAEKAQMDNQIAMAKVEQQAMSDKAKTALEVAKLELEREKVNAELLKIRAELEIEQQKLMIEQQKSGDEHVERMVDAAIKQSEHTHNLAGKEFERALKLQDAERSKDRDMFDREIACRGLETESEERAERKLEEHEKE